MTTLLDVLSDTMLAAANGFKVPHKTSRPFPIKAPNPQAFRPFVTAGGVTVMKAGLGGATAQYTDPYGTSSLLNDTPIWNYDQPTVNGTVRLENLTCRVSGMNFEEMAVCDLIEWGPVSIHYDPFGCSMNLPLQPSYIVREHFLPEGGILDPSSVPELALPTSNYWKLPAKTDQSFEIVFGYEFPLVPASQNPQPLSPGPLDNCIGNAAHVCTCGSDTKALSTFALPSLKIIVVVSFVCCTQNSDFDPGGLLDAGRIYPFVFVWSSLPLSKVNATVKIARPSEVKGHCATHQQPPKTAYIPKDDELIMDNELMSRKIGSVLFTDRNASLSPAHFIPPDPHWDNLFDYYLTDPPMGSYTMVNPANTSPSGSLNGVQVTVADFYHLDSPSWDTPGPLAYRPKTRSVYKTAGQGEFDNLHLAPKMRVPASELLYLGVPLPNSMTGFDNIAMAPFCVHDCLHTHTRWSTYTTLPQNWGWNGEDAANQVPGAPLVPSNQKVVFDLLSPSSFKYCAEAQDVKPAKWQIFFHHGLAYALNFGALAKIARLLQSPPAAELCTKGDFGKWGLFYWGLHWTTADGQQRERISWSAADLAKLRKTMPGTCETPEVAPVSGGGH